MHKARCAPSQALFISRIEDHLTYIFVEQKLYVYGSTDYPTRDLICLTNGLTKLSVTITMREGCQNSENQNSERSKPRKSTQRPLKTVQIQLQVQQNSLSLTSSSFFELEVEFELF